MRKILLCFFSLLSILIQAQNTLTGIVLTGKDHIPVVYASVYISGTTRGTYTDSKGCFTLKDVSTPCQLVVSHVACDLKIISLDNISPDLLTITLIERTNQLSGVSVSGNSRREENREEFKKFFLGTDKWGRKAILKNDSCLVFNRRKDSVMLETGKTYSDAQKIRKTLESDANGLPENLSVVNYVDVFTAKTKYPLIIGLPSLGYTVYLDLVSFNLRTTHELKVRDYLMYCRFDPVTNIPDHQKKQIKKNRKEVYYNSARHFCKSIFDNTLIENGFLTFADNHDNDQSKQNKVPAFDINRHVHYVDQNEVQIVGLKDKQLDIYYFCKFKDKPLNLAIVIREYGPSNIPWVDCDPEDNSYVIFRSDVCTIRADGTIPDNNIQFGGKIATKAGGALLPNDYSPENEGEEDSGK